MTAQDKKIRWGIIGPGGIAQAFRDGVKNSHTGQLVAIGTRSPDREGLGDEFPGTRIHKGYDALLADPDVEAVYIALPHTGHAEWAIKAAEAGKHVLVEKPMALSAFEIDAVLRAHRKAGTFAGEAFMYRLHPATKRLADLIGSGAIGEVRMIQASFGFQMPKFMPEHRLFANDLAGGGILDVGGYPVSMARFIAGAAVGKPFLDPVKVSGMAHLGQAGTDEWSAALLEFDNGIIAQVSCAVFVSLDNVLRIHGATGRIEVANFWFVGGDRNGGPGVIDIVRPDGKRESTETGEQAHLYSFEADAAGEAIRAGRQEFAAPGMSWADSLGNARVLDKWRADVGLVYDLETPARRTHTIKGEALSHRENRITRQPLKRLTKEISQVALGFEDFRTFSSAAILLDAFFEAGGNLFDTGFIYGGGMTEALWGDWQKSRGVREQSVVIAKGAHSPLTYPDVIGKQLQVSLDRLKTDYVDLYFMHRDNPDIPVGEFVDAMDVEVRAGRIRGLHGGSNWSRERFDEAVAYATKNGKAVPSALSNNFSLAEMIKPIWAGCIAASDDDWKAWLKQRQIPDFAWSSQGRGFFTERAGRDKLDNAELVNTWYSEKNFGRRDRAIEMAKRLGRQPIHIALAYVLAQPFPVIPLIGPRTLAELDDSISALDIKFSAADIAWLESGATSA